MGDGVILFILEPVVSSLLQNSLYREEPSWWSFPRRELIGIRRSP